jgi:NAD(P)H-dependent flavin oxidoreductase YrpB (nitropropane dioxygenase family)
MLKTAICDLLEIEYPLIAAGMGGIALAELAAAVSEAGALGTIGLAVFGPEGIHNEISAARTRTKKPLAANLLIPFLRPGIVEAVAQSPVQAVTFFWGDARDHADSIGILHRARIKVLWQCGSANEARWAKAAGADAVMAQGFEAGGHVRAETTTLALIPEVRDAIGDTPLVASGGIADGRGLAAALALGADGAALVRDFSLPRKPLHITFTRIASYAPVPAKLCIPSYSTSDGPMPRIAYCERMSSTNGNAPGGPNPAGARARAKR